MSNRELRAEALQLATRTGLNEQPNEVVARAEEYFSFLSGLRETGAGAGEAYQAADTVACQHADTWIEWSGGDRPVAGDTLVRVRYGDGDVSSAAYPAGELYWDWKSFGRSGDIHAYRIVEETPKVEVVAEQKDSAATAADFQPGDIVQCVDAGDWPSLMQDGFYTVARRHYRFGAWLTINTPGCDTANDWLPSRFKLVARAADGWRIWRGGENPAPGSVIEWRLRGRPDDVKGPRIADGRSWHHGIGVTSDIIAYRVIEPSQAEPVEQWNPGDVLRLVGPVTGYCGRSTTPARAPAVGDLVRVRTPKISSTEVEDNQGVFAGSGWSNDRFKLHRRAREYRAGDIMECVATEASAVTIGKRYEVRQDGGGEVHWFDDHGHLRWLSPHAAGVHKSMRLALDQTPPAAEDRPLQPGDRVKHHGEVYELVVGPRVWTPPSGNQVEELVAWSETSGLVVLFTSELERVA